MVKKTISSIKKYLVKEQNEILSAAVMLMILGLATKIIGMLYLTFFTHQFGISSETDIFYLSSVIPETITNIILIGAISGSIIPIFVKLKEKNGEKAFLRSFSVTFNTSMLTFIVLSVFAGIFAKQLIPFAISLAHRQTPLSDKEILEAIWMMRALLVPQVMLAISAFLATTLNIYNRFVIPQLAPFFFNIGRIVGIIIIVPLVGGSIWGVIWGTWLGAFLHILIQLPLLKYLKIRLRFFHFDKKDKYFRKVLKLGLPRIFSLGTEQFAIIIDSIIAFGLTTRALSALQLGVRLISFPLTLFGTSYAIASFPSLSKLYANGKKRRYSELVIKIINQVLFLSIPVSIVLIVLRVPIVRLVYGIFGGEFDWDATLQIAWVVMLFAPGLIFESLRSVMFRIYYSIHDSKTPMISSIFVMIFGIITGITFTNYFSHFGSFSVRDIIFDWTYFFSKGDGAMGVGGLALSSSFVFSFEFFFLLMVLRKKGIIMNLGQLVKTIGRKLLAGLVMFVALYVLTKIWEGVLNTAQTSQLIILTGSTIITSGILYIWISLVFKVNEVEVFINYAANNIKKLYLKVFK